MGTEHILCSTCSFILLSDSETTLGPPYPINIVHYLKHANTLCKVTTKVTELHESTAINFDNALIWQ